MLVAFEVVDVWWSLRIGEGIGICYLSLCKATSSLAAERRRTRLTEIIDEMSSLLIAALIDVAAVIVASALPGV